jgi:hypothetical protein
MSTENQKIASYQYDAEGNRRRQIALARKAVLERLKGTTCKATYGSSAAKVAMQRDMCQ